MRKYIFAILLILPSIVFAQNLKITNPAPGVGATAWDFIHAIIQILKWIVIPIIVLVIIYSGFQMVTAGGDMTKIKTAKGMLLGAIIGAAVLFGADTMVNIVRQTGENILPQ